MILERFVRDIDLDGTLDSIGDSINSASKCVYFKDKFWYPERDFGEEISWVPSYLNPLSCVGERTLSDVEFLLWCFLIQMIFCSIGMFLGCVGFMCKSDDGSNQSKSGASSGGSHFFGLLSGVFGFCAVRYDLQWLLWGAFIVNFIIIIFAAIGLILMIIGLCGICCAGDGCGDRMTYFCYFILNVIFLLLGVLLNILIIYYSWGFLLGESPEESLDRN
jgi:hypothetical protein